MLRPLFPEHHLSPGPMTRSLPLARPSRASTFGRMDLPILQMVSPENEVAIATGKPFAASQAAQVPHFVAERETERVAGA